MNITEVKINIFPQNDRHSGIKLVGIASIVVDDGLKLNSIKILSDGEQIFIDMPKEIAKNNQVKDVFHPINQEARDLIKKTIREAYERELENV